MLERLLKAIKDTRLEHTLEEICICCKYESDFGECQKLVLKMGMKIKLTDNEDSY